MAESLFLSKFNIAQTGERHHLSSNLVYPALGSLEGVCDAIATMDPGPD